MAVCVFFNKERIGKNVKKLRTYAAAGLLMAVPVWLAGCQGGTPSAVEPPSSVVSAPVSQGETVSSTITVSQPEPFRAADGSFSVVLPQGFVEQNSDPVSGTTTWVNTAVQAVLVATSVQKGLEADALTQEAMTQTLSATYEQVEMNRFTQTPKKDGTLFLYDAAVTQNGNKSYLIQALYADSDQTVTLAMTISDQQKLEQAWGMMQAMADTLALI